ncbi:beta-1,4 N-acetylgalactosaminyltransferase 2-like [Saccoglossus kowalevskii]|uniref:Beta-14 n-acetylgalactosaminyltransferase 1-like 261 n=1 Tax=Saccoglossus kowalevskii TaxID=10224 RepID=A0A0U2T2L2_SACKO|nr:beta-14 n-acetylgalactosaminyltransferase 1-like 261 [Saccoglossus kowalevskii]
MYIETMLLPWKVHALLAYFLLSVALIIQFYGRGRLSATNNELYTRNIGHYNRDLETSSVSVLITTRRERDEEQSCDCEKRKHTYGPLNESARLRRQNQLEEWHRLEKETLEPTVMCPPTSPFSFVGGGTTVEPLQRINMATMLAVDNDHWNYHQQNNKSKTKIKIISTKSYGIFEVAGELLNQFSLIGIDSSSLTIVVRPSTNVDEINALFASLYYRSVKYDIQIRDIVSIEMFGYTIEIHIRVQRKPFPRLYDVSRDDHISKKITIITKTFMRASSLFELIKSVRIFYPNITIVVADDSRIPLNITDAYTKYYVMPFAEGWFAGRNLALSQVRTKYFLWVDDDFIFSKDTKLEKFLEKLEANHVNVDIVSGVVHVEYYGGHKSYKQTNKTYERFYKDGGYCVHQKESNYGQLDGFPQCVKTDNVLNFFMAKTIPARRVGFDPALERVGHFEFFWDGLGQLRVIACDDVSVLHRPRAPGKYYSYRYEEDLNHSVYENRMLYSMFKNNLNCVKGMYKF